MTNDLPHWRLRATPTGVYLDPEGQLPDDLDTITTIVQMAFALGAAGFEPLADQPKALKPERVLSGHEPMPFTKAAPEDDDGPGVCFKCAGGVLKDGKVVPVPPCHLIVCAG